LLLCAIASCFVTTFRVLAEYSKWEYVDLQVEAIGTVDKAGSGYAFSHIILRPHLKIPWEQEQTRALQLLQKTQDLCLVSRVISVTQDFEPVVDVGNTVPDSGQPA
jgi:organic hydroperoxide reductase OsmC/OhrA